MGLSDTDGAISWLDNFPPGDRELAKRLLDAFVLDTWTSARASLLELVRDEILAAKIAGAVWVLPAMDSGDIRKANGLSKYDSLVAFENFDPGMDIPAMPGSEGLVGHLLRDVQETGVLPPTATLSRLRDDRLRTVIVVSDTIETGGQVSKYLQALLRNPSLRSWKSFRWIKFVVVAFAVSTKGERVIKTLPGVDALRFVRHAPTIASLPWPSKDVEAAVDLCRRLGRGNDRLGYGDHAGLFGFQDRVPNTVPKIFRQSGPNWVPLFTGKGGRHVPSAMVHELAGSPDLPVAHDEVVRAARQERLAVSIGKQQRKSNRDILSTLALLRASPGRVNIVGATLNMTQAEVEGMLAYLIAQGWIDADHRLTARGILELAAGKKKPRRVEPRQTAVITTNYYPESLR